MAVIYYFDDVLFDPLLIGSVNGAQPITGGPELANSDIFNPATGIHKINISRYDAVQIITIPVGLNTESARDYFNRFWRGGQGSGVGFRVRIPYDYKMTGAVVGTIAASTTAAFNLVRTYTRPGVTDHPDVRRILKPVVTTNLAVGSATLTEANGSTARTFSTLAGSTFTTQFAVTVGGASTGFTYTINNKTGVLTVTTTSASGNVLVTCEYDTPMAFLGNSFQLEYNITGKVQGLTLRELLAPELGL